MEGNKETKEVFLFVADVINAGAKAYADKKIGLDDAMLLVPVLQSGMAALGDIEKVLVELRGFPANPALKADISASFKSRFDLADNEVEARVELAVDVALSVVEAIVSWGSALKLKA